MEYIGGVQLVQVLTIGDERFRCSEALFDPSMVDREDLGIHNLVVKAISRCEKEVRRDLCSNILLSGGTTILPGRQSWLHCQCSAVHDANVGVCDLASRRIGTCLEQPTTCSQIAHHNQKPSQSNDNPAGHCTEVGA